jgi:hypothetical protein
MKQIVKHAVAWSVTAFITLLVLVLTIYRFGPELEAMVFPLFKDVKGSYVDSNREHTDLIVTGIKARNCLLVATYATVRVDGNWLPGQAKMMNQDGSELTVENQRIATGAPFVRLVGVKPGGTAVRLVLESYCHPLWLSRQQLPEFTAK